MKTTLDIPNDLYRQAKAIAALEKVPMKDLVTEGLRLVLEERGRSERRLSPLEVLKEVRRRPLHTSAEVARVMQESGELRKEGWSELA